MVDRLNFFELLASFGLTVIVFKGLPMEVEEEEDEKSFFLIKSPTLLLSFCSLFVFSCLAFTLLHFSFLVSSD